MITEEYETFEARALRTKKQRKHGRRPSVSQILRAPFEKKSSKERRSRAGGNYGGTYHAGNYGITDYRLIPRSLFITQPLLEPEEKKQMSIGTLYVKVIEARGLMAADLMGRSDPYLKMCLTGRYLSHGQEWSEDLRIRAKTGVVKYTLNPVWNEEFTLPVRRAGAILKVDVFDWDRSSNDDPLGYFEINIGEDLLAQRPKDAWYVLEAPRGRMDAVAAAAQAAARAKTKAEGVEEGNVQMSADLASVEVEAPELDGIDDVNDFEADSDVLGSSGSYPGAEDDDASLGDDTIADTMDRSTTSTTERSRPFGVLRCRRRSSQGGGKPAVIPEGHFHMTDEEARKCPTCIEFRRLTYGEVRLELWYQFDPVAETCSHIWPEERFTPARTHFSPNQLYRKMMLFWEMFRPYFNFMHEADMIVCWADPRKTVKWLVALVIMLLVPYILLIVVNGALIWIIVAFYLYVPRP